MSSTNQQPGNGIDHGGHSDEPVEAVENAAAAATGAPEKPEDPAPAAPKTTEQREIEALQRELAAAHEKLRQYSEAVDKVRQEFAASTARMEREQARLMDDKKLQVVTGLLDVSDTLHQALQGAGDGGKAFVDGITIVCSDFDKALGSLGLERFDPTGATFDPEQHDALTMVPVTDDAHDGKVVQVVHAGARVGDKVLRPAKVVVGKKM